MRHGKVVGCKEVEFDALFITTFFINELYQNISNFTSILLSSIYFDSFKSSECLPSIRKTALQSPAALPKKKIRLFSPQAILPPKTSTLLFGSPKIGALKIASSPEVCVSFSLI